MGKLDALSDRLRDVAHLKRRRTRVSDFSLPAAVAMSGAAISPSMGKLTRRPFRFLLALANVRLGVWVPNPRWVDAMGSKQTGRFGRPRPSYLFNEMIGRNRIGAKYLYVTDGGHYENLGLVELLRRGCRRDLLLRRQRRRGLRSPRGRDRARAQRAGGRNRRDTTRSAIPGKGHRRRQADGHPRRFPLPQRRAGR